MVALALAAGAAHAEVETTPVAMAVDPATYEMQGQMDGPVLATWPGDSTRYSVRSSEATWTEVFGPTSTVRLTERM